MKKIVFLLLFLISNTANAAGFTYTQYPSAAITPLTVEITVNAPGLDTFCDSNSRSTYGIGATLVPDGDITGSISSFSNPELVDIGRISRSTNANSDVLTFTKTFSDPTSIYSIFVYCGTNSFIPFEYLGNYAGYPENYVSGLNTNILFTACSNCAQTDTNIWPGGNMFGSTTPLDLVARVGGGVRESGTNIWPLFAIVGVGLTFVLSLMLLNFINRSIKIKDLELEKRVALAQQDTIRGQKRVEREYKEKLKKITNT